MGPTLKRKTIRCPTRAAACRRVPREGTGHFPTSSRSPFPCRLTSPSEPRGNHFHDALERMPAPFPVPRRFLPLFCRPALGPERVDHPRHRQHVRAERHPLRLGRRLTNPGTVAANVTITFIVSDAPAPKILSLGAGQTVVYRDVVGGFFASPGLSAPCRSPPTSRSCSRPDLQRRRRGDVRRGVPVFSDRLPLAGRSRRQPLGEPEPRSGCRATGRTSP